jgi:hypothetical protein
MSNGWTPQLAVASDGKRRILRVADWFGGTGEKPLRGIYLGKDGYVSNIAAAEEIRGDVGPPGLEGREGGAGATWRSGAGAPSDSLGENGDYYLDESTGDVYLRTENFYSIVLNINGGGGVTNVFRFDRSWEQDVSVPVPDTAFVSNSPGYVDLTTALDGQGYSAAKRTQVIDAISAGQTARIAFGGKFYFEASPPAGVQYFTVKFGKSSETAPRYVAVLERQILFDDPLAVWIKFGFVFDIWFDTRYKFANVSMYQESLNAEQPLPAGTTSIIEAAVTADSAEVGALDGRFYLTAYGGVPTSSAALLIERTSIQLV